MGFVRPIRRRRAWRPAAYFAAPIAVLLGIAAYPLTKLDSIREPGRPQQAGQPLNPYVAAAHIAVARADALVGDTRGAQAHVNALAHDLARSARVPDTTRPINHEAARAAVQPLPGVRSAIWLDATNLVVMVDGPQHRSMEMIDRVCLALEPLGDTLSVVVNLQDVTAKKPDAATTLARNCQLKEGQRAFMQAKRQVDVVAPELRRAFKAQQQKKTF